MWWIHVLSVTNKLLTGSVAQPPDAIWERGTQACFSRFATWGLCHTNLNTLVRLLPPEPHSSVQPVPSLPLPPPGSVPAAARLTESGPRTPRLPLPELGVHTAGILSGAGCFLSGVCLLFRRPGPSFSSKGRGGWEAWPRSQGRGVCLPAGRHGLVPQGPEGRGGRGGGWGGVPRGSQVGPLGRLQATLGFPAALGLPHLGTLRP